MREKMTSIVVIRSQVEGHSWSWDYEPWWFPSVPVPDSRRVIEKLRTFTAYRGRMIESYPGLRAPLEVLDLINPPRSMDDNGEVYDVAHPEVTLFAIRAGVELESHLYLTEAEALVQVASLKTLAAYRALEEDEELKIIQFVSYSGQLGD